MTKKTVWMLAFALLMPALFAMAQEGGPQGEGPGPEPGGQPPAEMEARRGHPFLSERYMATLEKKLSLSAEQKAKVEKAIAGAKDGLKTKFDAVRKAADELHVLELNLREEIRKTLTNKQKETFDGMQGMGIGMGGPGMRGGPGGMGQGGRGPGGMGQGGIGPGGMGPGRGGRRPMGPGPRGQGGMGQGEGQPPREQPQTQE
ncbi:MAG: hypothetical protein PHU21_04820 [Elusimicrobia bacterium]|nr:hypothetical protein [Elusimicrobiota bacterium]